MSMELIPTPCGETISLHTNPDGSRVYYFKNLVWEPRNIPRALLCQLVYEDDKRRYEAEHQVEDNKKLCEADLHSMMRDPKYWRDKDPATIAKVTKGFAEIYK